MVLPLLTVPMTFFLIPNKKLTDCVLHVTGLDGEASAEDDVELVNLGDADNNQGSNVNDEDGNAAPLTP